jgi:hypothetical protein
VVEDLNGTIARIGYDHASGVYYISVTQKSGHLFTLDATEHPELPVSLPGDAIYIKYENSGERVMPVVEFQNLAVPLQGTSAEGAVKEQADQAREQEAVRNAASTVQTDLRERLEKMTPAELQKFEKTMQFYGK